MGGFLFWLLWPYVVARQTRTHYVKYTGEHLPREYELELRRALAKITPPIVKPEEPKRFASSR